MSVVFLMTGNCTLGVTTQDKDGNITKTTPAQFAADDAGGSVAVGRLDPKTMQPIGPVEGVFGDWDAAGYLEEVLKLLSPHRSVNIPDLKALVQTAYFEDGNDLLCDYCKSLNCHNCIIKEWKEELEC